jgi:hypothetical protein
MVKDGPPNTEIEPKWGIVRDYTQDLPSIKGVPNHWVLAETNGYGVTVDTTSDECHRQYGSYVTLNETERITSDARIVSFLVKATDPRGTGIGTMFNVQEAIPGFRPTASYYRYAWGQSPDPTQYCDKTLYHNGAKHRFEEIASRLSQQ